MAHLASTDSQKAVLGSTAPARNSLGLQILRPHGKLFEPWGRARPSVVSLAVPVFPRQLKLVSVLAEQTFLVTCQLLTSLGVFKNSQAKP